MIRSPAAGAAAGTRRLEWEWESAARAVPNVPPPASTGADRRTMETELAEKGLPEGPAERAVAGYLYFPFPGKKHDVAYDLEYRVNGERFLLPLGKYASK